MELCHPGRLNRVESRNGDLPVIVSRRQDRTERRTPFVVRRQATVLGGLRLLTGKLRYNSFWLGNLHRPGRPSSTQCFLAAESPTNGSIVSQIDSLDCRCDDHRPGHLRDALLRCRPRADKDAKMVPEVPQQRAQANQLVPLQSTAQLQLLSLATTADESSSRSKDMTELRIR